MSRASIRVAAAPLAAALLALAVVFLTGLDRTTPLPPEAETRFYGFFLDRYPLFAFAIVYALARVAAAACLPGPASIPRRVIGAALGLALVLGLSLHPTFGGLILRAGFMTGGVAFLNQVPLPAAYLLGAAVAAAPFGLAMGLGVVAAGQPPRPPARRWRRLGRAVGSLLARFLALWFALALLGAARDFGLGPWPRRPLDGRDAALAAGCLVLGFLPHALLAARRASAGATVPRAAAA